MTKNKHSTINENVDVPVIYVLNTFLEEFNKLRPSTDIAFSYITPNDILFTAYYDVSYGAWSYAMGKLYKHLRTFVPGTKTTFNSRRFYKFVDALKEAKASKW